MINDGGQTRVFHWSGGWVEQGDHFLAGIQSDAMIRYGHGRDGQRLAFPEHDGSPPRPACPGDATLDGLVDIADLPAVVGAWGQGPATEDLDWNGTVDIGDILEGMDGFGACDGGA